MTNTIVETRSQRRVEFTCRPGDQVAIRVESDRGWETHHFTVNEDLTLHDSGAAGGAWQEGPPQAGDHSL